MLLLLLTCVSFTSIHRLLVSILFRPLETDVTPSLSRRTFICKVRLERPRREEGVHKERFARRRVLCGVLASPSGKVQVPVLLHGSGTGSGRFPERVERCAQIRVSPSDSGNESLTSTQRKELNMQEVGLFLHLTVSAPPNFSSSSFILSFTDFSLSSHFLTYRGKIQGMDFLYKFWELNIPSVFYILNSSYVFSSFYYLFLSEMIHLFI